MAKLRGKSVVLSKKQLKRAQEESSEDKKSHTQTTKKRPALLRTSDVAISVGIVQHKKKKIKTIVSYDESDSDGKSESQIPYADNSDDDDDCDDLSNEENVLRARNSSQIIEKVEEPHETEKERERTKIWLALKFLLKASSTSVFFKANIGLRKTDTSLGLTSKTLSSYSTSLERFLKYIIPLLYTSLSADKRKALKKLRDVQPSWRESWGKRIADERAEREWVAEKNLSTLEEAKTLLESEHAQKMTRMLTSPKKRKMGHSRRTADLSYNLINKVKAANNAHDTMTNLWEGASSTEGKEHNDYLDWLVWLACVGSRPMDNMKHSFSAPTTRNASEYDEIRGTQVPASLPFINQYGGPQRLEEGYDEFFDPPLESKYECPICLLGLRDPVQTPCGHRFCFNCIRRSIR
ncbi:predicted protein [Nematostella vectensis]|uniref:RING-type domain-containing protein n=1 Tax=Nematostella vectensis TaxID=45351 RepID=A7T4K5_NEMVE|nr:predicted protein [Nematostella vectensis]|eukprot:XP_001621207.1 hypothetical protein NEMVEDRAFT_v1g222249 [Nematostella vectensis]